MHNVIVLVIHLLQQNDDLTQPQICLLDSETAYVMSGSSEVYSNDNLMETKREM